MFPFKEKYPELHYLDNAATTEKPEAVILAMDQFYREKNANPLRGIYQLSIDATAEFEAARVAVRDFINAKEAAEIIFTKSATEGLNLVAFSYGSMLEPGDEILVAITEHHSNFLPWQRLAKDKNLNLNFLYCNKDGSISPEMLREKLTPRTKLFAVTQVSNVLGMVYDIKKFTEICHENGTVIVCDAAQSVAHMPIDVQNLDVDFLAFSGHKMYGPTGIGVLFGKRELLEQMPPFLLGGGMVDFASETDTHFSPLPQKFEAGTVDAAAAVGLHSAIDFIRETGFSKIMEHEKDLTKLLLDELSKIPQIKILGSKNPDEHLGIVSFNVSGVHPHDVASFLDSKNIAVRAGHHCAQPLINFLGENSAVRISIGIYNTKGDIMSLATALGELPKTDYDEVLNEHNLFPAHKHELPSANYDKEGVNPSCGDDITLHLKIEDGVIRDGSFTGNGCAISQASTDIMLDLVIGKPVDEAKKLAGLFIKMINNNINNDELSLLKDAAALENISKMPARTKCATLSWHTMEDICQKQN